VPYITILIVVSNNIVSGFSRSTPSKTNLPASHNQITTMSSSLKNSVNSEKMVNDDEHAPSNILRSLSESSMSSSLSSSSTNTLRRLSSSSANGLKVIGGGETTDDEKNGGSSIVNKAGAFWGTFGVVYILAKAIKRVLPIALEPFNGNLPPLSRVQLAAYVITCVWFAYVEGYKGFQCKFSPLVVKRSQTLQSGSSSFIQFVLAPLYSMGLFHATKKRMIVSWSVTTGVAVIVALVKKLPYPYRNIVDAGVVAGLGYGSISILLIAAKSFIFNQPPSINPELPVKLTS